MAGRASILKRVRGRQMKKFLALGSVALVVAGCTPEMEASMARASAPKVVAVNAHSVTVSAQGNTMRFPGPDAATRQLALKTCKSIGKNDLRYQSTKHEAEFYRNHHLFLCVNSRFNT